MTTLSSSFTSQNAAGALASSRELILVIAPDWKACAAQLQRFARTDLDGDWQPVGAVVPVSLGRGGLAWGLGLHARRGGVEKREGDGCTPAGIFAITALFGIAAADSSFARDAKLP